MEGDQCGKRALPSLLQNCPQRRPDWVHLSRPRPRREWSLQPHKDLWALLVSRDERPAGQDPDVLDQKWLLLFFPKRLDLCSSFSFWRGESQLYNISGFLHQLWERDRSYPLILLIRILSATGLFPPFFVSGSNKSHITGLSVNNGSRIEVKDKTDPIRISFTHSEQEVLNKKIKIHIFKNLDKILFKSNWITNNQWPFLGRN